MKAKLNDDKSKLILEIPTIKELSKSKKTTLIASTKGPKSAGIKIDGKDLMVNVNAYIPRK